MIEKNIHLLYKEIQKIIRSYKITDITVIKKFVCLRCGRKWFPKKINTKGKVIDKPKVCFFCNSNLWNIPRKNKTRGN